MVNTYSYPETMSLSDSWIELEFYKLERKLKRQILLACNKADKDLEARFRDFSVKYRTTGIVIPTGFNTRPVGTVFDCYDKLFCIEGVMAVQINDCLTGSLEIVIFYLPSYSDHNGFFIKDLECDVRKVWHQYASLLLLHNTRFRFLPYSDPIDMEERELRFGWRVGEVMTLKMLQTFLKKKKFLKNL